MIITVQDLRVQRMCRKGAKAFFDRYGLDWTAFTKAGIDEEKLLSTNDALAVKLVEGTRNERG